MRLSRVPQAQLNPIWEAFMPKHPTSILALSVSLAILSAAPALAQGEILITQAKANAGNVTPGDAAGFPVTLSLPGSYEFAGNLQPPANKAGIRIASNDVTIDLNGFRLRGAGVATTGIYGDDFKSVTIRNGTISGFDNHGIYGSGRSWIVEDMRVVQNGAHGIFVNGFSTLVRGSTVTQNAGVGISCTSSCHIEDSTSSGNGGVGIDIDDGTVLGNVIIDNAGLGIDGGIYVGYGNNTLASNNSGGDQVNAAPSALHPNFCLPTCP
jgi:hypothetical protein